MATYGLELKSGTNNSITIADTESDMSNYVAVEYGVGTNPSSSINLPEDLIFIRYNPDDDTSSSSVPQRSVILSREMQEVPNPNYDESLGDYPWNQPTFFIPTDKIIINRSVEYIVLKPANSVTDPTGDYGLQLINKEGRVQFDSRASSVNKSIRLDTYYPVGSVGIFVNIYDGSVTSAELMDSSFDYFYSMNDIPSSTTGIFGQTTTVTRALIFVPSGNNNYVWSADNPQTITSGVYAQTITSGQTIDLGLVSSGPSYYYVQQRNDFIVFKGTLVE